MTDAEGRRIIDQGSATHETIANADAFIMDSSGQGSRCITYSELLLAIAERLDINTITQLLSGAMQKSRYDSNDNGIVDNAEKVGGFTVQKAVPADAKFTDTVYDDTTVLNLIGQKLNTADYKNFTGATSELEGEPGRVPAPGTIGMYLASEGAWQSPDSVPTANSTKLITSGAVKDALDNIEIDVDSALNPTSENPVQNKAIYQKLVSTAQADNVYHIGFYFDADGDLCQA